MGGHRFLFAWPISPIDRGIGVKMDYAYDKDASLSSADYELPRSERNSRHDDAPYALKSEAFADSLAASSFLDRANGFSLSDALTSRYQHSLAQAVSLRGIGIHSGITTNLTIYPAAAGHGIVFRRSDLAQTGHNGHNGHNGEPNDPCLIAARYNNVANTNHCSQLQNAHGVSISTVEHLMAALAALKIDNVLIDCDGPEIPIMDGSATEFVHALQQAGRVPQNTRRAALKILRPILVENKNRRAELRPLHAPIDASEVGEVGEVGGDFLRLDFTIEFSQPIGRQSFRFDLGRDDFIQGLAAARTFCFADEVALMQQHGLGLGGSLDNSLVVVRADPAVVAVSDSDSDSDSGASLAESPSAFKVLNPQGLRYRDECVRHKTLDAIGDLYLAGAPIIGHFRADRGGHEMTNLLLRAMFSDAANYAWV